MADKITEGLRDLTLDNPVKIELKNQERGLYAHTSCTVHDIKHVKNVTRKMLYEIASTDTDQFAIVPMKDVNAENVIKFMTPNLKRFDELSFDLGIGEYYVLLRLEDKYSEMYVLSIDYVDFHH